MQHFTIQKIIFQIPLEMLCFMASERSPSARETDQIAAWERCETTERNYNFLFFTSFLLKQNFCDTFHAATIFRYNFSLSKLPASESERAMMTTSWLW